MGGPPVSVHTRETRSSASEHAIWIWPVGIDSAPYFAALVINSCNSNAKPVANTAEIETSGPVIMTRCAAPFASS